MSWTPCPLCWSPLVGYEGSACTNPNCINGERVRSRPVERVVVAPLTGQVTTRIDEVARARRKRRRKAQRAARRANRRAA